MSQHHKINYIELPVKDLIKTKAFFTEAFGWQFKDYGPEYSCFLDVGIEGGFYVADENFKVSCGSPLIVLYSQCLETSQRNIIAAGGSIVKAIFNFPGGKRFHFDDVNGNEYAVWSE
ncbi:MULTISPECIES: VOC family protein [unclassified Shewanella]|uniref:VOC family protein n=1 Tax=unclassified Shewanella TaxID=196818 RepID=UPI000C836FF6|nr:MULTISPECIES: VOC family protein [unclassified Shewanella]MDO6641702.1 VOC family protein [Shewanella sp. 5_MG-2023]MDO6777035.1 VOC family protein [Shewanella sp. 3_MG-2023]PMG50888.1 glyoxalase [Shewanella sp. 10N.286.52.B9]